MLNFLRNYQTVFRSGCIIFTFLPVRHQGSAFSISSQTLAIFHFWGIIAILMGIKWHLIILSLFLKDSFPACRILDCLCFLSDVKRFCCTLFYLALFSTTILLSSLSFYMYHYQSTFKAFSLS